MDDYHRFRDHFAGHVAANLDARHPNLPEKMHVGLALDDELVGRQPAGNLPGVIDRRRLGAADIAAQFSLDEAENGRSLYCC